MLRTMEITSSPINSWTSMKHMPVNYVIAGSVPQMLHPGMTPLPVHSRNARARATACPLGTMHAPAHWRICTYYDSGESVTHHHLA